MGLEKDLIEFISKINRNNYLTMYDELEQIVLIYKGGLNNEEVLELLNSFYRKSDLDDYQEEVFFEIGNRVKGVCPDFKKINLG